MPCIPSAKATAGRSVSLLSHLAYASGYYIAWENMNRADMLHASINAFNGDTSKLAELIRTNLVSVGRGASTPAHLNKQNPPRPKSP